MEVQRRLHAPTTSELQTSGAFQYLAFSVDADSIALEEWIAKLVRENANALGVVSKVREHCPGAFKPFNHLDEKRGGIRDPILNGPKGIGLITAK